MLQENLTICSRTAEKWDTIFDLIITPIRLVKEEYWWKFWYIFFLFFHKNICCGYSLEVPQWGTSNEYPQHMFLWRTEENYPRVVTKYFLPLKSSATTKPFSTQSSSFLVVRVSPLTFFYGMADMYKHFLSLMFALKWMEFHFISLLFSELFSSREIPQFFDLLK